MAKVRGFEIVADAHRKNFRVLKDDNKVEYKFPVEITLPTRADARSAGYDFYLPCDVELYPNHKMVIWTDVKAYMQDDEVLEIYVRSSLGVKKGIVLANQVGIIDSSYYGNEDNDGNIGIALHNTTGQTIELKAGERIAQGIFKKFLVADNDAVQHAERKGGFGSSGK